jgi:small subunit ribosomal protein S16
MKQMGRTHRPFYRICAMDQRAPRDGRVLEELGTYDPMVSDVDARAVLNAERIDYWIGVGAQPSEKVGVLIKKYGSGGTRVDAQREALERLAQPRAIPDPGPAVSKPKPPESETAQQAASAPAEAAPAAEAATESPEPAPAEASEAAPAEAPAETAVSEQSDQPEQTEEEKPSET